MVVKKVKIQWDILYHMDKIVWSMWLLRCIPRKGPWYWCYGLACYMHPQLILQESWVLEHLHILNSTFLNRAEKRKTTIWLMIQVALTLNRCRTAECFTQQLHRDMEGKNFQNVKEEKVVHFTKADGTDEGVHLQYCRCGFKSCYQAQEKKKTITS